MQKMTVLFLALLLALSSNAFSATTVELQEIVVIANKTAESSDQTASTTDTISSKKLKIDQSSKLSEILQSVSGINITGRSLLGDDVDIRMRGSDRDEVLVLLDGVPIEGNAESSVNFLNILPTEFIDKIEIIKGSQSILYGSNAVGGVINIITKKTTRNKAKHFAQLSYTSNNSFRESLGAQIGGEKSSLFFGVLRDDSRILNNFNDQSGATGFHAALVHSLSDQVKLSSNLEVFFNQQNLPYDQINTIAGDGKLHSYIVTDRNLRKKLRWIQSQTELETKITDRLKTTTKFALNALSDELTNSNLGNSPIDEAGSPLTPNSQSFLSHSFRIFADNLSQYRLIDTKKIKNDIQLGFNFINDHLNFDNNSYPGDIGTDLPFTSTYPGPGQKSDRQNYSLYFQNLFYWQNLTLTAGARVDHNTTFGNEFSPRITTAYRFQKTATTLRASYSEGFHAPTIAEFFDATIGGTPTALALKLKQETSRSYEAGIEQKLFTNRLKIRSTYFYTDYDQLLDLVEVIDGANSQGLETDIELDMNTKMTIGGNHTYNHTNNDETGRELTLRSQHTAHAYLKLEPIKNFSMKAQMEYVSKRKNPETLSLTIGDLPIVSYNNKGQTSPYSSAHTTFDLLLNYKWEKPSAHFSQIEFYADVKNLLNSHFDNYFGYPASGFTMTLGSHFYF